MSTYLPILYQHKQLSLYLLSLSIFLPKHPINRIETKTVIYNYFYLLLSSLSLSLSLSLPLFSVYLFGPTTVCYCVKKVTDGREDGEGGRGYLGEFCEIQFVNKKTNFFVLCKCYFFLLFLVFFCQMSR